MKNCDMCGHIHEEGEKMIKVVCGSIVKASHIKEYYQPVNKPIRVIL